MTSLTQSSAFDFLHGSWAVEHALRRGRLDGTARWDTLHGRAVCAPILAGVGQLDQIWLPHRMAVGATLRLYDEQADCWRLHWSSSDAARLDPPLEGRFVDGVGTFFGHDVLRGEPIDVRFTWDDVGPANARWTQAFAPAGTRRWEPNWIMRFTRTSYDAASAATGPLDLT